MGRLLRELLKKTEEKLPEELIAEQLGEALTGQLRLYKRAVEQREKQPTMIIHNKIGWVGWLLFLVLGVVIGSGFTLYGLRTKQVEAVFQTRPQMVEAVELTLPPPIPKEKHKGKRKSVTIQVIPRSSIEGFEPIFNSRIEIPVEIPMKIPFDP